MKKYTKDGGMYEKGIFKKYNRSIYENNVSLYTRNTKVYRWNKRTKKKHDYSMRYLIMSEMLMVLCEGKIQRFTETAYKDTKYLENINKTIKQDLKKIPDAEIYTDVFSRIEKEEIEEFQYKINYQMIRNKVYENAKVLGKYNLLIDGSGFQKAHYEVSLEWLSQTKEGKTHGISQC